MWKIFFMPVFLIAFAFASWAGVAEMPEETVDPGQAFISGAVTARGEGAAPDGSMSEARKRMLAMRAAKTVALREAAEMLAGVSVTGETTVKNAMAVSDAVRTSVRGLVKGAQVVKEVYDPVLGAAAVYVSVPMPGIAGSLIPHLSGGAGLPVFKPLAAGAGGAFDGLIIDARAAEFKPALMNRIVTKGGEAVYDPSRVAGKIIAERGAAGYTNDIGKARSILAERGSVNPLLVKASGASSATDVELGPEDASAVFHSNQSGRYLEAARVVFVLD